MKLPHFPDWHWRGDPPHQIALPLFILAALLMLCGLFGLDLGTLLLGVIALAAALVLERRQR